MLPGRNARQCKDRYEKYLDPNINVSPFTQEEDKKLLSLRELYGPKWILISKHFNNRSDNSLKSRYKLLMRQNKTKENQKNEIDSIIQTIFKEDENLFNAPDFFGIP